MKAALLLIALGFGYRVFCDACRQRAVSVKRLGQAVGIVMMVMALLGALCTSFYGSKYWGGKGYCASCGKSAYQCPFAAKKGLPYSDVKPSNFRK